ncbi:hypothetical protein Tco_0977469 [Tanacetum coccineum]|uniref:Uncharacterized protein n=1 Tax=Tanacetum coccineum TaxID=301880 RepID=A0ABQ5ELA9_9ASTR
MASEEEPKIVDDDLLIRWNYEPHNTNDVVDNHVADVVEDVSEDQWLKESLRKLGRMNKNAGHSSRIESINVDNVDVEINEHEGNEEREDSEHGFDSEQGSDSEDKPIEEVNEDEEDIDHEEFDIYSATDSDNEDVRKKALRKLAKLNKANDGKIWKENFYFGQQFGNSKLIKQMTTRVCIEQRRELHLKKNDKQTLKCICRGQLPVFTSDGLNDGS